MNQHITKISWNLMMFFKKYPFSKPTSYFLKISMLNCFRIPDLWGHNKKQLRFHWSIKIVLCFVYESCYRNASYMLQKCCITNSFKICFILMGDLIHWTPGCAWGAHLKIPGHRLRSNDKFSYWMVEAHQSWGNLLCLLKP